MLQTVTVLIPLPMYYNADERGAREAVEDKKFLLTASEVSLRFGGGTLFRFAEGRARGFWWDKGILHQDTLALLEVDVPDTARSRSWLRRYAKTVLIERFEQDAIYLKFVGPVETLEISHETVVRRRAKHR
jgi:hypothetical protein